MSDEVLIPLIVAVALCALFAFACGLLGLFYALEWAWWLFRSLPRPW